MINRYMKKDKKPVLESAHPDYEDIPYTAEFTYRGKMVRKVE